MNTLIPDDEFILRYLDGEMTEDEAKAFADQLENDADLQARTFELKQSIQALKLAASVKAVQKVHQQLMQERQAQEPAPVRSLLRYSLSAAAVITILALGIAGWWAFKLSADKVYTDNFLDYSISTVRGIDSNLSATQKQYSSGNNAGVIQLAKSNRLNAEDSLLTALSYLHLNNLSEAHALLESIRQGNGPFQQDAEYYLGMTALRQKNYSQALDLFKLIYSSPVHLYHQQVGIGLIRKVQILKAKSGIN